MRWIALGDKRVLHATGKVAAKEARSRCAEADLVVVNVRLDAAPGCDIYDIARLRRLGALALTPEGGGIRIVAARDLAGTRLWSP